MPAPRARRRQRLRLRPPIVVPAKAGTQFLIERGPRLRGGDVLSPVQSAAVLRCGRFSFPLDQPLVMGVVNITPDSFSDGGRYYERDAAIAHARRLAEEGAHIIDIGGESTRPGSAPVTPDEELARILPVIQALGDLCISVDTRRPAVMQAALDAGASMINDVQALQAPDALAAVRAAQCA